MTLVHILVFSAAGALHRLVARGRARVWVLLVGSLVALYWLQPATPILHLDFWLPTASLGLAVIAWSATRPRDQSDLREPLLTFAAVAGLVLALGLTRYLGPAWRLTPTRPPAIPTIALALASIAAAAVALHACRSRRALVLVLTLFLLALFVALKTEPLATAVSAWLRSRTGQPVDLASPLDLRWLGFSYLAFRLLHTLRDRASGRLPSLTLGEYLVYIVFFPALTAGPIDRVERFVQDLRAPASASPSAIQAGTRLILGVFKKFVLADSLAILALNPTNAAQTTSTGWLWILLYAFAFRLYLDFSGYTDIAIGLGNLFGIALPENFDRPYLRPNLTAFWNAWHMTLAGWFRAYVFNPLTRVLRSGKRIPPALIILIGQMTTMTLIGLWHGVSWNFALWGAWHGLGLFLHNRWNELLRSHPARWLENPTTRRMATVAGTLLTFHYVLLGWVWFALPSLGLSARVFSRLLGF